MGILEDIKMPSLNFNFVYFTVCFTIYKMLALLKNHLN